jgi:hypothetical protein
MTNRISFLFAALSLAACGGSPATDAGHDDDTSGGDRPVLAGHWRSDCTPTDTGALTLDFTLDDVHWSLDYDTYADANCATRFITVHVAGSYELIARSPTVAGAWNARFGFDEKTVAPHGDAAVGFLASLGDACGGPGTWSDGVGRDVYASGCAMLGQYPSSRCTADYDVVSIDAAGLLHFGQRPADNDMCTEDERPTMLSPLGVRRVST